MNKRKIKSITLYNFQGHRNNTIELHNNLNAIVGRSGCNKSGILKGIEWVYENTVMGESRGIKDSIHSHAIKSTTKKGNPTLTDVTYVQITFNDGIWIKKTAGNKPTFYEIYDPIKESIKELTAVGSNVPDQVLEIFNFHDVNFQHQWSRYFLLFDTPGEVAKKLNEYTDMTLPDQILKKINSDNKKTNAKLKVIEEDIQDKEMELEEYKNVEIMEKALDKLTDLWHNLEKVSADKEFLEKASGDIEQINSELNSYSNLDTLIKLLEEVQESSKKVLDVEDILLQAESCLDDWNYLEEVSKQFESLPTLEKHLNELSVSRRDLDAMENTLDSMLFDKDSLVALAKQLEQFKDLDKMLKMLSSLSEDASSIDELDKLVTSMTNDANTVRGLGTSLVELERSIEELEKELTGEVCPLCGSVKGECADG